MTIQRGKPPIRRPRTDPRDSNSHRTWVGVVPDTLARLPFPCKSRQMELSGALLNPRLQVELPRLARLRERLAERDAALPAGRTLCRRQGSVLDVVTAVLERAGKPLRVRDIHADVEEVLGGPIPF